MRVLVSVLLAVGLATVSTSQASVSVGVTTFSDRAAWETALGAQPVYCENFDTASASGVIVDGTVIQLSNGLSIVGQGTGGLGWFTRGGRPPAFPTQHIETDFEGTSTKLVFRFACPVTAFGFDYAAADFAGSVWIEGAGFSAFAAPANPSSTNAAFLGVIVAAPLSEFSIATAANDQEYFLDNLSLALVPEPATLSLLALGGLLIARRRRA